MTTLLVYGATGYTGRLIAREAAARGTRVVLAGRNADAVRALAEPLGFAHRAFSLADADAIGRGLAGIGTVLHCAGPFSRTSEPMASACLRAGVNYLDITGEIDVFEALAARRAAATRAGVVLLPGVGFDVVPSDSLSAHLAGRLPSATHLELALSFHGGVSRGTATTMLEAATRGASCVVRRGGRLETMPFGAMTIDVDFGDGPRPATAASWGDVSTAYYSTGIPDITVYMGVSRSQQRWLRAAGAASGLLRVPGVSALAQHVIRRGPAGPDDDERSRGYCRLWCRVTAPDGQRAAARMLTPDGYAFTARAALWAAEQVEAGRVAPGFHTPTTAFGPDVALRFEGVERTDVAAAAT